MKQLILTVAFILGLSILSVSAHSQNTKYVVTNASGVTLSSIYVEPAGATAWTTNVYISKDPFTNNGSYEFARSVDGSNCIYDIKYVDVNGFEYYERNVNLCNNTSIVLPVSQPMRSITIKNNTGITINAFYIALPGTTYWSNNLSNRSKIMNGETFSFLQKMDNSACKYDIKIEGDDGMSYILKDYDLCAGSEVVFSRPDNKGGK